MAKDMSTFTVLGASGFIGRHLVEHLAQRGLAGFSPERSAELHQRHLGSVIYCIGLTADFRSRPLETVEAHVTKLSELLKGCDFDSLLYLSSARVYRGHEGEAREDDPVQVNPLQDDHIYNISKLMGESLSLNCGRPARVARLSAVYGSDYGSENFLSRIIREAITKKKILLETALDSQRDYISVNDVVETLIKIAVGGRERIYNVASGQSVSHLELTNAISEITGCQVEVKEHAPKLSFPPIDISRIRNEFGFQPARILDELKGLVDSYRRRIESHG